MNFSSSLCASGHLSCCMTHILLRFTSQTNVLTFSSGFFYFLESIIQAVPGRKCCETVPNHESQKEYGSYCTMQIDFSYFQQTYNAS